MPKSRRRKKKGGLVTKVTFKKRQLPINVKSDNFSYECKCVALKQINIGTGTIKQGEVFYLKDAFVDTENGQTGIFLGIKLPSGRIYEAGFSHPNTKNIRSKKDMDDAIFLTLIVPYVAGTEIGFID